MANEVKLTLVGDSKSLEKATQDATSSTEKLDKGFGKTVAGAVSFAQGLQGLGDSILGVTELMHEQAGKADRLARQQTDVAQAALDVEQAFRDSAQAVLDYDQAQRDLVQAGIDVEQALLDQEKAQKDYNEAVKEYGPNSIEARQAQLDLKQAVEDVEQANLDQRQAQEDANQALLDGKQAAVDATTAQLDLNEAQREAGKNGFTKGVEEMGKWLNALMPIVLLVTGAQWAFNASLLASPVTWIVLGIVALIAVIVLLIVYWDDVKKAFEVAWNWIWDKLSAFIDWWWDIFWTNGYKKVIDFLVAAWATVKNAFGEAWDWIKDKAMSVWNWFSSLPDKFKEAFDKVKDFIIGAFKAAFNAVSNIWNNTIGKLSWTVPSWVPFIGGNTISAPKLPTFHKGGIVPGLPGQEVLAVLQAGERVIPRDQVNQGQTGDTYYFNMTVDPTKFKTIEDFLAWVDNLRNNRRRGLVTA